MLIYHGSTMPVEKPQILKSERMLDFGEGFYTTCNREQAITWSKAVAARRETTDKFLSIYDFDFENAQNELAVIIFDEPNEAWLDFICANRSGRNISGVYDIVLGPVANDKVYNVVQFYENNVYDKSEAIRRLKVDALYSQILFHTQKALSYCRFVGYEHWEG